MVGFAIYTFLFSRNSNNCIFEDQDPSIEANHSTETTFEHCFSFAAIFDRYDCKFFEHQMSKIEAHYHPVTWDLSLVYCVLNG